MIHIKNLEVLKTIAELETEIITGGIMFLYIENRTIRWKAASKSFNMDIFQVGSDLTETSVAVKAMNEKRVITQKVPREKYGKRLLTVAIPLVDDENIPVGAFSVIIPRLHPVAASFGSFAPVVSELFPEGAFLYMSDLTKIAYVQPSHKFTLQSLYVGYELKETDIAYQTISTGKPQSRDLDAQRFGVPVYIANYPLYDEDDGKSIVATLGVVIPKSTAGKLKDMSENLSTNLDAIAKTVEHFASNAATINENQQNLFERISLVSDSLKQINEVSEFISSVANQSNMLGLNASIEASRAGESGRGFAIVADEIRKLSIQSKDTVPKIKQLTSDIQYKIKDISEKSRVSLQASEEQAAASEEISASIEDLATMTSALAQISKEL